MFLGSLIKQGLEGAGPKLTQTEVKLADASFSLLSGAGKLKDLVIGNPAGCQGDFAVRMSLVEVSVHPGSLLSERVLVRSVRVIAPEIRLEGDPVKNNLSAICDNVRSALASADGARATHVAGSEGAKRTLQVDVFSITGARVFLKTGPSGSRDLSFTLPDIQFTHLGQNSGGVTGAELTRLLLAELSQRISAEAARQFSLRADGVTSPP